MQKPLKFGINFQAHVLDLNPTSLSKIEDTFKRVSSHNLLEVN